MLSAQMASSSDDLALYCFVGFASQKTMRQNGAKRKDGDHPHYGLGATSHPPATGDRVNCGASLRVYLRQLLNRAPQRRDLMMRVMLIHLG